MGARNRQSPNSDDISVSCPPGWLWLLAGIVIGMFASFLIYLQEFSPAVPPEQALAPPALIENTPRISTPPPSQIAAVEEPPQRFQFYDIPNTVPKVPDNLLETPSENPVINSTTPAPATGRYILQVGLFRNSPEAEGLKKYLVSLQIPATVEEIVQADTGKWHRVQVGPFSDLDKLNKIRNKLTSNNFETILIEK
jgi:cell division protein FtsN